MDTFFLKQLRLFLYFIVGFLLSSIVVTSYAGSVPAEFSYSQGGGPIVYSGQEACNYGGNPYVYKGPDNPNSTTASCTIYGRGVAMVYIYQSCARIGGTISGVFPNKVCTCPDPAYPSGGKCVIPDKCQWRQGQSVDDGTLDFGDGSSYKLTMAFPYRDDGNYVGQTFCSGGCAANVTADQTKSSIVYNGESIRDVTAKYDGTSCPSNGVDVTNKTVPGLLPKDSEEKKCVDSGKAFGYVNDKVVCVTPDKTGANSTKTNTTTNSDGTKTKTDTNTTISCTGEGSCTTTTTTVTTVYNSDGSQKSQTSDTKSETKSASSGGAQSTSFCQENPDLPICKKSSANIACGSFSCDGDAVQCAALRIDYDNKCNVEKSASLFPDVNSETIKFDKAKSDAALNKDGKSDIDLFSIWQSKRQDYVNYTKSCPAGKSTLDVMGKKIDLDITLVCTIGEFVSLVVRIGAYLVVLRLFAQGIK